MTQTAQTVIHDIRNHIFEKFMKLPVGYYEEQRRGELLSVVTGDVNILSDAITMGLISFITDIISLILVTFLMLSFDLQTGILIVVILPVTVMIMERYRRKMRENFFQIRTKVAQMNANIEENVSGIRVAQSLVVENRNVQGFNQISQQTFDLRMQTTKMFAKMNAVMSIAGFIGLGIVLGVGGYRTIIGEVGLGELLAFFQYTQQFTGQIMGIAGLSNLFFEAGAALLHIRKSTENAPEIPEPLHPISLPLNIQGKIELQNVRFSYSEDVPLFSNLNLQIHPKEKIGIVGETGAG